MKTAYLFPGLNGLLRQKDRERYLELPNVQLRLKEAQAALSRELELETNLLSMLAQNTDEIYRIELMVLIN